MLPELIYLYDTDPDDLDREIHKHDLMTISTALLYEHLAIFLYKDKAPSYRKRQATKKIVQLHLKIPLNFNHLVIF